jgi:hypothetical protein
MKRVFILIGMGILILSSCSKGTGESGSGGSTGGGGNGGGGGGNTTIDCTTVTNKAFNADVLPIITGTCAAPGCHATGSNNGPGALTNYTQIFNARVQIRDAVATGRMPQTGTLSTAQKGSIICWIDSGAANN